MDNYNKFKTDTRKIKNALTLVLKVNNFCDQDCSYCYHYYKNSEDMNKQMSLDMVKESLSKIGSRIDNLSIHLHGGEPLLTDKNLLISILNYIGLYIKENSNHKSINCIIQTNLVNIDDEIMSIINKNNITLSTSFDGKASEKTRHLDNQDFINNYNKYNSVGFVNVITKLNMKDMDDHINYIESICNAPMCNPVFPYCCPDSLKLSPGDFSSFIIKRFEYQLEHSNYFSSDVLEYLEPLVTGRRDCLTSNCLNTILTVTPEGNIKGCDVRNEKEFIYGNINEISRFEDIFELSNYKNVEKIYFDKLVECSEYDCFDICHGGCINRMTYFDNSLSKDSYCYDIRILVNYFKKYFNDHDNDINKLPIKLKNQLLGNKGETNV